MKRRFALFVILTLVCTGVFAKEYEHYAWFREKHEDRYISITLEVYSPHDEGISEKAAEKLDEIEETLLKTAVSLIPSPRAIHISVIYIGSISTPLYKVEKVDLIKIIGKTEELGWYLYEVYNKKNEKVLSEEVQDYKGIIFCYIIDKLVAEVYPDKYGSTKIGDKGPEGGTIFYANGNIAYEVTEKLDESNKNVTFGLYPYGTPYPYCYWDIPTSQQLEDIYNNLVKQGFFEKYKNEVVWSSSKNAAGQPIVMSFSDGELYYLEDEFSESGIASLFLVKRFVFYNE